MDVTQRYDTIEKITFYKNGAVEKIDLKVKFNKKFSPKQVAAEDAIHIFKGLLVCIQSDTDSKASKDIKKALKELIKEL